MFQLRWKLSLMDLLKNLLIFEDSNSPETINIALILHYLYTSIIWKFYTLSSFIVLRYKSILSCAFWYLSSASCSFLWSSLTSLFNSAFFCFSSINKKYDYISYVQLLQWPFNLPPSCARATDSFLDLSINVSLHLSLVL